MYRLSKTTPEHFMSTLFLEPALESNVHTCNIFCSFRVCFSRSVEVFKFINYSELFFFSKLSTFFFLKLNRFR